MKFISIKKNNNRFLPVHPNIISILGYSKLEGHGPCIVMEWMNATLLTMLRDPKKPLKSVIHKLECCKQIALGLAYLHQQNPVIIHRDLAARNCLVCVLV
jgi:serine/threonine protein kinase